MSPPQVIPKMRYDHIRPLVFIHWNFWNISPIFFYCFVNNINWRNSRNENVAFFLASISAIPQFCQDFRGHQVMLLMLNQVFQIILLLLCQFILVSLDKCEKRLVNKHHPFGFSVITKSRTHMN